MGPNDDRVARDEISPACWVSQEVAKRWVDGSSHFSVQKGFESRIGPIKSMSLNCCDDISLRVAYHASQERYVIRRIPDFSFDKSFESMTGPANVHFRSIHTEASPIN